MVCSGQYVAAGGAAGFLHSAYAGHPLMPIMTPALHMMEGGAQVAAGAGMTENTPNPSPDEYGGSGPTYIASAPPQVPQQQPQVAK